MGSERAIVVNKKNAWRGFKFPNIGICGDGQNEHWGLKIWTKVIFVGCDLGKIV